MFNIYDPTERDHVDVWIETRDYYVRRIVITRLPGRIGGQPDPGGRLELELDGFRKELLAAAEKVIRFETDTLRLELASDGRVQGIVDRTTGANHVEYLDSSALPFPFMAAVHENQSLYPTAMCLENDHLVVKLGVTPQLTITLRVEHFAHFLTFEVVEFQGPPANPIRFVQLPVDLAEAETSKGYAKSLKPRQPRRFQTTHPPPGVACAPGRWPGA